MAGFYKTNNRTRQLSYTLAERKIRLVLEAMESLEKYKSKDIDDKGIVKTTIREIQDVIFNREANEVELPLITISRCINQLCKDGDIQILEKSTKKGTPSTYKLMSHDNIVTNKDSDSNGLVELDVTNSKFVTNCGTHCVTNCDTNKDSIINTLDGVDVTNNGTNHVTNDGTSKIRINNKNIYTSKFNEIWKLYPRREGKKSAYRNYVKLEKKFDSDEIKRAVERYAKEMADNKTETKYIKMGEGFFNPSTGKVFDYFDSEYEEATNNTTDYLNDYDIEKARNENEPIW